MAAGFEPAVGGYPTIAFEAITFGRSDTPPRSRLREWARATKSLRQRGASAARCGNEGRGLVVLQATDNLVGLVLDAFGSVRQLVLSLGGDLVGLALVSYVLVVGSFAVGFLCLCLLYTSDAADEQCMV